MAQYNSEVDIFLSYDTDFEFSNGDIKYTEGMDQVKRKLFKILSTVPGDWKMHREVGGKPIEFIGKSNTRETGLELMRFIQRQVRDEMAPIDVKVKVVPISRESAKVYIDLILIDHILDTIPFSMDFINGITYTSFDEVDEVKSSKNLKIDNESLHNPNPIRGRLVRRGYNGTTS